MPPTKDYSLKNTFTRTFSSSEMTMAAKVYHPPSNLTPPTPPTSPTGPPTYYNFSRTHPTGLSRQNSQNGGKYS